MRGWWRPWLKQQSPLAMHMRSEQFFGSSILLMPPNAITCFILYMLRTRYKYKGMRFEGTNEGAGTGRLGALQPPLSCYICWCSNSVSKKWQDNFSGKYITTNEGNYWWLSIEAGSPIGTEERLHWGRNILPSSLHSFLSSYELGTFTSCFHLHIKFQQNPKVVLWRNTKPNNISGNICSSERYAGPLASIPYVAI